MAKKIGRPRVGDERMQLTIPRTVFDRLRELETQTGEYRVTIARRIITQELLGADAGICQLQSSQRTAPPPPPPPSPAKSNLQRTSKLLPIPAEVELDRLLNLAGDLGGSLPR
jgi:hypothetical protein